ncbi:MAG TPA: HipA family kinase [Thermoanaerobaculia bacterium]
MIRTVYATRYVTPLREGGSLPAIVEADDLGFYVLKFRGAGQGPLALVAELLAGEIGRALGLQVPELVKVEVDAALGRNEEDPEIRDLLKSSVGVNLGLDYLPGSLTFDPAATSGKDAPVEADLASAVVWFDAFVTNVDRTPRNPNLLCWHKVLYLIDHGAALYFHHNWPVDDAAMETAARGRFAAIRDHVLLPWASRIEEAGRRLAPRLDAALFTRIVEQIPEDWLAPAPGLPADGRRAGYVDFLTRRLAAAPLFVEEAVRARAQLV